MFKIRNLLQIRKITIPGVPNAGPLIAEALQSQEDAHNLLSQQVNGDSTNQRPSAPSPINAVNVTGQNGHFNIAVTDNNQNLYSGVKYYAVHADNPQFTNAHIIDMGSSRNHNIFLGNVSRYWGAYSAYSSSASSAPAYHGGSVAPTPVQGGGDNAGPNFQPAQGSGTGAPNQPLSGSGPIAYRTTTGRPPLREAKR